jgi:DNA-binding transcriptional MerR regulator
MVAEGRRVYTTGELAERLGVSTNMARRYGLAWEKLSDEEIPQQPGRGRMYSQSTLEALEGARAWLIKHPAESIESALRVTLGLELDSLGEPKHVPGQVSKDDIREVVREGIAEALAPIMAQLEAVRAENDTLKASLQALPAPQEAIQAEHVARLEQLYAEADKRAHYAMDELKRRDEAVARKRRPWWPWRREP